MRISPLRLSILSLLATAALLGGCANSPEDIFAQGPEPLYDRGYNAMQASNYEGAIAAFNQLKASFPFSNLTRQAQLDLIYVYYTSGQPEAAIDAAQEFERENPTHPRVDYALYMRGRVHFDASANVLERIFRVDMSQRPPKETESSFAAFQELIRRFPDSEYVADAQQRMVFLRNRLAAYENHVARYYLRRGAFVSAAKRAQYAIEHYPGAPELEESLELLITAYESIGMNDLAQDARRVLTETFGSAGSTAQL